jgi:hypothetical protein
MGFWRKWNNGGRGPGFTWARGPEDPVPENLSKYDSVEFNLDQDAMVSLLREALELDHARRWSIFPHLPEKMRAPKGQDDRRSEGKRKRKRSVEEKDGGSGSARQEGTAKLCGVSKVLLHNAKLKLKKKKERLAGAREEEGAGPSETSRGIAGGKAMGRQEEEKSRKTKTRDVTRTYTDTDTGTGNEKKVKSSKKQTHDTTHEKQEKSSNTQTRDTTHTKHTGTHPGTGFEKKAHDADTDTEKKEKSSKKKTQESQDPEDNVETGMGGAGGDQVEEDDEEEEVEPWGGVYVGERSGTGEFSPRPTKREDPSARLGGSERVGLVDEVRGVGVYECA